MKTILEALRKGNAKEKLAVIADLTTIAGVSIATILASMVTLVTMTSELYLKNVFGVIIITIMGLIVICLLVAFFIFIMAEMSQPWRTPRGFQPLIKCTVWLIFICLFLYVIFIFCDIITSFNIFL